MRFWVLLFVAGCASAGTPRAPLELAPPPLTTASAAKVEVGPALPRHPDLHALVQGPSVVHYEPQALGLGGQSVSVRLTNTGPRAVHLGNLRLSFSARRDQVDFPCREHTGGTVREHEPSFIEPGQTVVFARDLDCTMPLPGRYDVRVYVELGDGEGAAAPADPAGAFPVELVGRAAELPRPHPGHPGLYAFMTGSRLTQPLPAAAWTRGDYHVVIAFINAGERPMTLGPSHMAFLVYKKGSPLPCSAQAEPLAGPEILPSGGVRVLEAPVRCAPSEEGQYQIVGRLGFAREADVEIGRIGLEVSEDPLLLVPSGDTVTLPWPPRFTQ